MPRWYARTWRCAGSTCSSRRPPGSTRCRRIGVPMPEAPASPKAKAPRRPFPAVAAGALVSGAVPAALAGLGGAGGTLAQLASALAVPSWRRGAPARAQARGDTLSLSVLWVGTAALFAALLAWPFAVLLASGTLGATLASSSALGLALLAAW